MDLAVGTAGLEAFAAEVGPEGPVVPVGGRTQWTVGGLPAAGAREVSPPAGVRSFEPAEMTACCFAGTTVADLHAELATHGQTTALPEWPGATVGGVLAVGRSGVLALGRGPVRDAVLRIRYVDAGGQVVTAGGSTVKNVSGYDVCRLLIGSLGTLGLLGEVLLRTRPLPATSVWLAGPADPFELRRRLHRPAALLWDGTTTWVALEGHPADVAAQAAAWPGLAEASGPPPLPEHRWSMRPSDLINLNGSFMAEVGIGIVHRPDPPPKPTIPAAILDLHERLKAVFDPKQRLNPGRTVLPVAT